MEDTNDTKEVKENGGSQGSVPKTLQGAYHQGHDPSNDETAPQYPHEENQTLLNLPTKKRYCSFWHVNWKQTLSKSVQWGRENITWRKVQNGCGDVQSFLTGKRHIKFEKELQDALQDYRDLVERQEEDRNRIRVVLIQSLGEFEVRRMEQRKQLKELLQTVQGEEEGATERKNLSGKQVSTVSPDAANLTAAIIEKLKNYPRLPRYRREVKLSIVKDIHNEREEHHRDVMNLFEELQKDKENVLRVDSVQNRQLKK